MRSIVRMGLLALLAVLALSAIAVSSASAASPEWYVKKKGTYEKLKETVQVATTENQFELNDRIGFLGISCKEASATGEIKANGAGTILKFEANTSGSFCPPSKFRGNKCETNLQHFAAVYLPWKTELYTEGTEIRQRIANGGSGEPAAEFECSGFADTCNVAASTHMTNNASAGIVEAVFDTKSGKARCVDNPKEAGGEWNGTLKIKPTAEEKTKGIEAIKVE
jgi:hypothetical protein